jgi:hypothetical protein
MTTPAQLNHQSTQHSGKVMPADVRPAPPAALISRPSAPPAPVPLFDPSVDDQGSASLTRRRALTAAVETAETGCSPAARTGRGARLVAAATVTLAVVGGLGWIGQSAHPRVPANTVVVEVGAGETIWDIARRVAPRSDQRAVVERVWQLNQIVGSAVSPGQQIQVPDGR